MKFHAIVFGLLSALGIQTASAGVYTDELAKCLVDSTTSDDRTALVRWMFTAMSSHPAITSLSTVTPADRDAANKMLAEMVTKLLTVSCKDQARQAIKYEGAPIEASFQVLGQVAGRELFAHPNVAASLADIAKYLDEAALSSLKDVAAQ